MFKQLKALFYRLYARFFTRRYRCYLVRTGESLPPPLPPAMAVIAIRSQIESIGLSHFLSLYPETEPSSV